MTHVTFDRPETLSEVLSDLAGRERPIASRPVPSPIEQDDSLLSWGRDTVRNFRKRLAEERASLPPRPNTTELMAEVANARADEADVNGVDAAMDSWEELRNGMVDRRVVLATWRGLRGLGERVLDAVSDVTERIHVPHMSPAQFNDDAALASKAIFERNPGEIKE